MIMKNTSAFSVYDCDRSGIGGEHSLNSLSPKQNEQDPQEPIYHRTNLIIWDWDDTIFPTHSFRTRQDRKDKDFRSKLSTLVCLITRVFTEMIEIYGASNVMIVTNGSPQWIHKCLNVDIVQPIFMKFQQLLKKHEIATISASTPQITRRYPSNPYKWKETVFSHIFHQVFDGKCTELDEDYDDMYGIAHIPCITSIGDSLYEYKASFTASKYMKHRVLNRVKLKADPSLDDMIFQIQDIASRVRTFTLNETDIELNYCSGKSAITTSDTSC